ncbi:MAG TPA: calcium-translocating P-type ATPase, PMCA-type [archaeon]|nr:calcium-translocating P-type ATPase, PMCA-type [archaeon]
MEWYKLTADQAIKELNSSKNGLSETEAEQRLEEYGKNKLEEKRRITPLKIFLDQFKSFLVIILIIAAVVSGFLGELIDFTVIIIIVILNALFGFFQEYKAEKAIEALKRMVSPSANVLRDGKLSTVPAEELVPGDILVLEEGAKIPADCRILEEYSLNVNESSLTGESVPVKKQTEPIKSAKLVADMKNMLWMGTTITGGKCKAIIISTGMNTEIGKIAEEIQVPEEQTPLQTKLGFLGKQLGILIVIIVALVAVSGVLILNADIFDMFTTGIALAVAAVPEGLPAVATLTLALGIRRMSAKNSIIRRLAAVETLGSCTVICSDKTGTLTKNEMTVTDLYVFDKKLKSVEDAKELLKIGVLCNNATIDNGLIGDPTEAALLFAARRGELEKSELDKKYPFITEIPFSSERKRMTVIRRDGSSKIAYSKGAVEIILDRCSKKYQNGKISGLTSFDRKKILETNLKFTSKALRVLAFAYRDVSKLKLSEENVERDLVFVGLMGMIDPPRDGVAQAIETCKKAGIRVVMITGDHANTAKAVAEKIGIVGDVITGDQLDKLNQKQLAEISKKVSIYARVSPQYKTKILEALKKQNNIVAMTGDGVNDAPALKRADIGIAMGITGTDVAKEASDMVLKDDNFSSIVSAVKEGRSIYDNIKKFVQLLLSANIAEVLIIALSVFIGFQFGDQYAIPLTALQLLWINLITDGLPALALGVDPPDKNIMDRKPRNPREKILGKNMFIYILVVGLIITGSVLYFFQTNLAQGIDKARTVAFTSLVLFELFLTYAIRFNYKTKLFSNKYLFLAVIVSLALQLAVVYLPPLQAAFKTVGLGLVDWGYILVGPIALFAGLYIFSLLRNYGSFRFEKG